jgi:hypothetical protein
MFGGLFHAICQAQKGNSDRLATGHRRTKALGIFLHHVASAGRHATVQHLVVRLNASLILSGVGLCLSCRFKDQARGSVKSISDHTKYVPFGKCLERLRATERLVNRVEFRQQYYTLLLVWIGASN